MIGDCFHRGVTSDQICIQPGDLPTMRFDLATMPKRYLSDVEALDVLKISDKFLRKKATGPDQMPMRAIKDSRLIATPILAHLVTR